jgi:hypothetical protein
MQNVLELNLKKVATLLKIYFLVCIDLFKKGTIVQLMMRKRMSKHIVYTLTIK